MTKMVQEASKSILKDVYMLNCPLLPIINYLLFFLFPLTLSAVEYFKPLEKQRVIQWINKENSKPNDLQIHYFWTTWCGPCAVSEQQLIDLKKKLGGKVSIYAYSHESTDLLNSHIKKKHRDKFPFFYAQIPPKEKSNKNDLVQFVTKYPHCFVTYKNNLIWHGNPTYPKKAFEKFIDLWLKGQWTKEFVKKQNKPNANSMKIIKEQIISRKKNLEEKIKIETRLSREYKKVFDKTSNYEYFSKLMNSRKQIFQAKGQLLSKNNFKKYEKKFLEDQNSIFKEAMETYSKSREELFFVARDLLFSEDRFKNPDLVEKIINKALSLKEEGTTYPDYNLWIVSLFYMEKEDWNRARHYNKKAILKCQKLPHCNNFIEMYRDSEKKIKKKSGNNCKSFINCLKSAFWFL